VGRQQGVVDEKRVAIMGGSYGGYSALAGAAFTPDVFRCSVDIVGPSNLFTLMRTISPVLGGVLQADDPAHWQSDDPKDAEMLKAASPLFAADKIKIPMLIGQGQNDPRVKQAESEQIVAAIEKHGGRATYVLYSDEGHGFQRPENRMDFNARAESSWPRTWAAASSRSAAIASRARRRWCARSGSKVAVTPNCRTAAPRDRALGGLQRVRQLRGRHRIRRRGSGGLRDSGRRQDTSRCNGGHRREHSTGYVDTRRLDADSGRDAGSGFLRRAGPSRALPIFTVAVDARASTSRRRPTSRATSAQP